MPALVGPAERGDDRRTHADTDRVAQPVRPPSGRVQLRVDHFLEFGSQAETTVAGCVGHPREARVEQRGEERLLVAAGVIGKHLPGELANLLRLAIQGHGCLLSCWPSSLGYHSPVRPADFVQTDRPVIRISRRATAATYSDISSITSASL